MDYNVRGKILPMDALEEGLLLFDAGEYFDAQEHFKKIPNEADPSTQKLYKALDRLNMGFCLYENEEAEKAKVMILDGYSKLRDLKMEHPLFSVNRLMHDLEKVDKDLQNGKKIHVIPKIHFL